MSRDGSGTYSKVGGDAVFDTVISETYYNAQIDDMVTALTQSIASTGVTTPTANLPMGTYKLTGLGAGSATTDSVTLAQVQAGAMSYVASDTGAADAYAIAPAPAIAAYAAGQRFAFVAANASTGASTLDVSGLGTKAIQIHGAAISGAAIGAGDVVEVIYDGTQFQMISPNAAASGDLLSTNNLSDVANGTTSINNLITPSTSGNVLTSDGTNWASAAPAGGGGAWALIGSAVAANSASLTVTGLDSTYDSYAIALSDIVVPTDTNWGILRVGDSSGVDSGASDYAYHASAVTAGGAGYVADNSAAISGIRIGYNTAVGSAAGEGLGAMLFLHRPGDGSMQPIISGTVSAISDTTASHGGFIVGKRNAVITLDRINFLLGSGNIVSGRMTVWGISHA